jgi:hypothetical protein
VRIDELRGLARDERGNIEVDQLHNSGLLIPDDIVWLDVFVNDSRLVHSRKRARERFGDAKEAHQLLSRVRRFPCSVPHVHIE